MRIKTDISLSSMTTVRIGGVANKLWCPESEDDLPCLPRQIDGTYRIISGGSNLLINDARTFDDVIYMGDYDKSIHSLGNGRYRVGSSVRVQRLIRRINKDGYGGIEELFSIPAMIGGLICMNASVPSANTCISQHLESVEVFDGERIIRFPKDNCGFGYRQSRFQDGQMIVLSAVFSFPSQDAEISRMRVEERMKKVKQSQDRSHPNFGSVFRVCDSRIMHLVRRAGVRKGGASFSEKTLNWLLCDHASFADAIVCINRVRLLHSILLRKNELEVMIWE